jgi:uncharacterized protein (TIGR00297 family)
VSVSADPAAVVLDLLLAIVVVAPAYRMNALTRGGAVAAVVVGAVTLGTLQLVGAGVLLAFFVTSVVLSRFGRARKRGLVDVGKHGARDAMQVIANGGVATFCALASGLTSDVRWTFAFAGAYAAATADTWATEVGTVLGGTPRSVLTMRPIPSGLSGGVSFAGTVAEIAGAAWIGAVFLWLWVHGTDRTSAAYGINLWPWFVVDALHRPLWLLLLAVPIAGVAGATLDSVLGATLQELRRCDVCARTCETDPHACGAATHLVRGVRGFSNDVVNLLATAAGAAVAFAIA